MPIDWRKADDVTRLILIRHGEPEAKAHGLCYGRLDVGLSRGGRGQIKRTARWLTEAPIAAVYTSPRRRTVETAAAIARGHGLEPLVRNELSELDFGDLEGLTYDEASTRYPEVYAAWMSAPTEVTFPGGEGYADLLRRVSQTVGAIRSECSGATAAIVTHGGVNRAILAGALNLSDADIFRLDQSFAGVSIVDYFGDTPLVRLMNGLSPG